MKKSSLPAPILLLLISFFLMASAAESLQARDKKPSTESGATVAKTTESGRLVITRSPTLGRNVTITLAIDGKPAGLLSWGGTYDKALTPGRHLLNASASRDGQVWQTTLEVRPGQTYSYSAAYAVDRLVLTRLNR